MKSSQPIVFVLCVILLALAVFGVIVWPKMTIWAPSDVCEYVGWRLGLRPNPPFVYLVPEIQRSVIPQSEILPEDPNIERGAEGNR
jgi:hypothetical protein